VGVVEGIGLMLRSRTAPVPRAVLVVDDELTAWWDALVAADPEGSASRVLSVLAASAAEARVRERFRVLDGDGLTPSIRARRPALRDPEPPSPAGRWVAYLPPDPG
jgi:hypothetical protein